MTIVRGVNEELYKEAIRVINGMPDWKAGMQKGQAVHVKFVVPISFDLR